MKTKHLFKAVLLLAGLSFSSAVQAQGDLDYYNLTNCTYDVYMKHDNGGCNVSYFMTTIGPLSSGTFSTGMGSGIVFQLFVMESGGSSGVDVGDCAASNCACILPNQASIGACSNVYTVATGGGIMNVANAVLKIY